MLVTSTISVAVVLLCRGGLDIVSCLVIAILAALASAFMELSTKDGFDTISCPAVAMLVIIPLVSILGGQ